MSQFALFHFQVIIPGVKRGKWRPRAVRSFHTDPSMSPGAHGNWGDITGCGPSSNWLLSQACDANPPNTDFVQAECEGNQMLSLNPHQFLLYFWSPASSHRDFWKDFCPGFLLFKGQILLGAACNEMGASSSRSKESYGVCFLVVETGFNKNKWLWQLKHPPLAALMPKKVT